MSDPDLQPTLAGEGIALRPLRENDFEALAAAAADPAIWEQHPDHRRYRRDVFKTRFFTGAMASGGALAVTDNGTGEVIGSSRFYEWEPAQVEGKEFVKLYYRLRRPAFHD